MDLFEEVDLFLFFFVRSGELFEWLHHQSVKLHLQFTDKRRARADKGVK